MRDRIEKMMGFVIHRAGKDMIDRLARHGREGITDAVLDGIELAERARLIKSEDEIECMRWAIAVAELGIAKMKEALRPGITERQLWGLLNYTNLANQGEWHEGRMLASGPRINPWLQEASALKG